MRTTFLAATLASLALLQLGAAPAAADESAAAEAGATVSEQATTEVRVGFSRAAVRALIADLFAGDELAPAEPAAAEAGGVGREIGRNLKLELRYDSRGPFEQHLADPGEPQHVVFLQLRARL